MIENITYRLLRSFLTLLARLPLSTLYVLSDIIYFTLYRIVRYRRCVVSDNLAACFPEKSSAERSEIERMFYRNMADYMVETIKLLHISDAEIKKRMHFENAWLIDDLIASGKSIVVYFSHCGNWEWAPSVTLHASHDRVEYCQVYRPLVNKVFDKLMLEIRSRFGSLSFSKSTVLRDLLMLRRDGKLSVTGFMSDQKPSHGDPTVKTMFLNRPTAFISGTENLARRLGMTCIYWDMEKISRGHYSILCRPMSDVTADSPFGTLTLEYVRMLESTIRRNPSIWLWTHKRWKYPVTLDN